MQEVRNIVLPIDSDAEGTIEETEPSDAEIAIALGSQSFMNIDGS